MNLLPKLLLSYGVAGALNWQPIDQQVMRWDDVPELGVYYPDVDQVTDNTANQWALMPFRWVYTLVQLPYCLVRHARHPILLDLIQTAFDEWNMYLPHNTRLGLNLTFLGYCANTDANTIGRIILGKPVENSPGLTDRRSYKPTIHIDARLTQSAGTFYNIMLHEIGHVIGCDHPNVQPGIFGSGTSVMTSGVSVLDGRLIQHNQYAVVMLGDAECLRRLYDRDFRGLLVPDPKFVVPINPVYPAHKHVSGVWTVEVPVSVPTTAADTSVAWSPLTAAANWSPPTIKAPKRLKGATFPAKQAVNSQNVQSEFSANNDVVVTGDGSNVHLTNEILPTLELNGSSNVTIHVNGDTKTRMNAGSVNIASNQQPIIKTTGDSGADVFMSISINPDIDIQSGKGAFPGQSVDVKSRSSPNVQVSSGNAKINMVTTIIPKIIITNG